MTDGFWQSLREYAKTVFTGLYTCEYIHWDCDAIFYIRGPASEWLMHYVNRELHENHHLTKDEEQKNCLKVCSIAIEHRHAIGTVEGFETFDQYLHYCIHEITGAGFVKSANKT